MIAACYPMQSLPGTKTSGRSPDSPRAGSFVGRTRELSTLAAQLDDAGRGKGGVVLVSGEPGIGKSRLLNEFSQRAQKGGWLVLTGHAYDTEGMPPYLPFIEALQEHVQTLSLEDLKSQLGDTAPEVGLLLPEVVRRLPGISLGPALEPQGERYRLFESISKLLVAIARHAFPGLLLCLEDLQWADQATLRLLDHVSRRLASAPLLIVATYRDTGLDAGSPLANTLERLARREGLLQVELTRLTRDEIAAMLMVLGGPNPPATIVDTFYHETEGNPFFMRTVFDYLSRTGRVFDSAGSWQTAIHISDTDVPNNARLVVERSLESVSEECRRILSIAAVVGRSFNYELLSAVADLDEATLLDLIDEAVAANLLASAPQGISFAHELIRQTLFAGLTQPRQQVLHLRIAVAIEDLYASDLDPYLADLAGHYGSAGTSIALDKTATYSIRAGDYAARQFAFDEALRLYDMALAVMESRGPAQRATMPEVLVKRAQVLVALARWPDARGALEAAAAQAIGEERAVVLLNLAGAALAPPGLEIPLGRASAQQVVILARECNRPDLEAGATALLAECDLDEGKIGSSLAHFDEAYSRGVDVRLPKHRQFLGYPRALYWVGRTDEAVQRGHDTVTAAREIKDVISDIVACTDYGLALTAAGRYREATETFEHANARALAFGAPGIRALRARVISMSCAVPMALFDYALAEALAEESRVLSLAETFWASYVSSGLDLMVVYVRRGEHDRADAMAIETEQRFHLVEAHLPLWVVRLAAARAEAALARGNLREALVLSGQAVEVAQALGRPKYEAISLSARGNALVRTGKKNAGLADLRQAIEVVRPTGDPSLFLRASSALLTYDGDDDLAAEAHRAVDRILADLPEDRKQRFEATEPVQIVRGIGTSAAAPRDIYPDALSEREVAVLRLLASGRSNREIATDLVISVRTVERHITNLYGKIGARGRADATTYALKQALV